MPNHESPSAAALGPHQGMPVLHRGRPLEQAAGAVILVHGRGASAENILTLAGDLEGPDLEGAAVDVGALAFVAPQARGGSWYPYSFLAPFAHNEPGLSSALAALGEVVATLEAAAIPAERIVLAGFSQGACLAQEFAARNARRWGGVIGFSGGLIGPPGAPRDYPGSLEGTPVFLGCSDHDPHVPAERVEESAEVFRRLGAAVTARLYPRLGHTINEDELRHARSILGRLGSL